MYLIGTHIPIYVDGDRTFVDDSWFSDLELASRFFSPHFGSVKVLGPQLPLELADAQHLREVGPQTPNLSLHPSIDERTRLRHFWPAAARQWQRDLAPLLEEADVVHASVDDPFRPMQLATMRAALKANKVTVLIGFDMDVWDVLRTQLRPLPLKQKQLHVMRAVGLDAWMRRCVRKASVTMLKEGLVYDRYSGRAKNPKAFCHSMHSEQHLIDEQALGVRLESMRKGRPLRLGYFGRFIERKGLADAIRILATARAKGVDASFHLIGEGPQRPELEALAAELGVAEHVRFEGAYPYGDELHQKLHTFDALLFTPTEEDTPRMVYDCYAAGLPLLTSNIAFLRRRAERDQASVLFDIGDIEQGAETLLGLYRDRDRLAALSLAAREAGAHHTVEQWYGRRRDWTIEAAERHAQAS